MQALQLNERAEAFLKEGRWLDALPLLQEVFLHYAKSSDPAVRAQVARALRGAALCYDRTENATMAEQIRATLERRFGADSDPKIRYWLELARLGREEVAAAPVSSPAPAPKDSFDWEFDIEDVDAALQGSPPESALPEESRAEESREGARSTSFASPSPSAMVSEVDVSIARIKAIFDAAFIECEISPDGILRVEIEDTRLLLHLHAERKFVQFVAFFGVRRYVDELDKLRLVNCLNDGFIILRWALTDETTLMADYFLPYNGGVQPLHIVSVARTLSKLMPHALRECDTGDIVA